MASLLGKADPTLVKGAFAVAQADVPRDMSHIYNQREENIKAFTEGMQQAWDSQFEAYNAFETRIQEKSDLAIANTLEGKMNDSMLAEVDRETREIKALMQTFDKRDKGSLEWKKLEARVGKLATTTKNNDVTWSSLIDLSKNGDLHYMGAGSELDLYEAMIDDYNNNTNFTNGQIIDGDFVYSLPNDPSVTMTMTELKNKLKIKDPTAPSNIQGEFNNLLTSATQSDRPWDDEYIADTRNFVRNHLKSENDRTNVMHHRFTGMKYSIWEYLSDPKLNPELTAEMHDTLKELDTDIDNDGFIDDALTYANPVNAVALQKEIIKNANSKDWLANTLTDIMGENAYGKGRNVRKTTNNVSGSSRIKPPPAADVFSLPWGDYPLPKGVSETRDARNVTEILNEKEGGVFTIGDEQFTFSELTGTFRKTAQYKAGKGWGALKTPSKVRLSKTQMIDRYGGAYKNIPSSYDATELNKRTGSSFGINFGTTKTAADYLKPFRMKGVK